MRTLKSYVGGRWHEAREGFATLVNPSTEEPVARASSQGIDFTASLTHARDKGGPALRDLTFAQRGEILGRMSKVLFEKRDELLDISMENCGTTRKDAKFDIDGATGTLAYYGALGKEMGDRRWLRDGDGGPLGRSPRFWGEHVLVPVRGAAVLINAFNFPAWGFGEKAAAALLAGVPIILKPATSTAWLAERCVEIVVEAGILPAGALSLISGSTGNLLALLGPQDVLSFTGSAATALTLRGTKNLLESSTRVNIEADSLNAAVLAPDVQPGSETWGLFVTEVAREISQKSGQKCTAVRRIFVPAERADAVQEALVERLADAVVGNPADASATMGPLATAQQLDDAVRGTGLLSAAAAMVHGTGKRVDGAGSPAGKGYFFAPALLRAGESAASAAGTLHELEVFAPVATLFPGKGGVEEAAAAAGRGGGSLVTSLYTDDPAAVDTFIAAGGAYTGRLYVGSEKAAGQAPGSGVAMPQSLHGGPGRAGGGAELGGLRALALYSQRLALQGGQAMIRRAAGAGEDEKS